jgi:hypothetical protein
MEVNMRRRIGIGIGRFLVVLLGLPACAIAADKGTEEKTPAPDGWKQKQFLISFWCPPPATEEALSAVAAEHYNLTWLPAEGLDLAAKHKLRAMLTSDLLNPAVLDDPAKKAQLDALIDRVKGHPAMEAYFITDEPGAAAFAGLGRLVAYLRQRDPGHLAYINLFPTYASEQQLGITADSVKAPEAGYPAGWQGIGPGNKMVIAYREHLRQFVETVKPDLISYDHYHFFKDTDTPQYFLNLGLIRQAAMEAGRPFLNIIQASIVEKVWRLPKINELRWLVFTTMAYGGRGISYFTYWGPESYGGLYQDGKKSPLAGQVAELNAEIEKFGPALMELDSIGVYHTEPLPLGTLGVPGDCPIKVSGTGPLVLGLFAREGKPSAFMVVNRDYTKPTTAMVRVDLAGERFQELDRKTGQWVDGPTLTDRTMKTELQAGDGRLFRIKQE